MRRGGNERTRESAFPLGRTTMVCAMCVIIMLAWGGPASADQGGRMKKIRYFTLDAYDVVEFSLTSPAKYVINAEEEKGRVSINFKNIRLEKLEKEIEGHTDRPVRQIQLGQVNGTTVQVLLDLDEYAGYQVVESPVSNTILVYIKGTGDRVHTSQPSAGKGAAGKVSLDSAPLGTPPSYSQGRIIPVAQAKTPDRELSLAADTVAADRGQPLLQETGQDSPKGLEPAEEHIADPLEGWNRIVFSVNDRFYFLVMKPVHFLYSMIGKEAQVVLGNAFSNITTPIRFVNALLQLKIAKAGSELLRFGVNSTVGILGLSDYAGDYLGIKKYTTDTGVTFGKWGIGPGFYLVLPILGPSNLRDGIGLLGDYALHPATYIDDWQLSFGAFAFMYTNYSTLHEGQYEDLKDVALDPYLAMRNAYYQNRKAKIDGPRMDAPKVDSPKMDGK